MDKNEYKII